MQVSEEDLRSVLSPAGFVWELTMPKNPDGATPAQILPKCALPLTLIPVL